MLVRADAAARFPPAITQGSWLSPVSAICIKVLFSKSARGTDLTDPSKNVRQKTESQPATEHSQKAEQIQTLFLPACSEP